MDGESIESRSWWWAGKPGMLQSMGSKESDTDDTTLMADWVTELTDWLASTRDPAEPSQPAYEPDDLLHILWI